MELRLIAVLVGDKLKYSTSVNDINRLGQSVLKINKESFRNESITSIRAQEIYDWIMSLGKTSLEKEERIKRLVKFCLTLAPENLEGEISSILSENGCDQNIVNKDQLNEFYSRNFHSEIVKHSKNLFLQQNYFHAVFEASKSFNHSVKHKANSDKDGQELMMSVFASNGVLKMNSGISETEKNIQDGIKFLTSGLMRAVRNPTAHEPALDWPINKQECLDFLSMISFLYYQVDKAIYYNPL